MIIFIIIRTKEASKHSSFTITCVMCSDNCVHSCVARLVQDMSILQIDDGWLVGSYSKNRSV